MKNTVIALAVIFVLSSGNAKEVPFFKMNCSDPTGTVLYVVNHKTSVNKWIINGIEILPENVQSEYLSETEFITEDKNRPGFPYIAVAKQRIKYFIGGKEQKVEIWETCLVGG